ncbi:MAG: hypothetical protein KJ006_12165, partial [Thermoleophilia bacterium]|nr:hypothetical protein [Thermoleophilia bacterium]
NSRYLEREGYGMAATELTAEIVARFIDGTDGYRERLATYEQRGNEVALQTIADRVAAAAQAPAAELRRARRLARTPPIGHHDEQIGEDPGR